MDEDPLCWLGFTPDAILTSCKSGRCFVLTAQCLDWANGVTGHIRTWNRPSELAPQLEEKVDS